MNNSYAISDTQVFISDEKGLYKRKNEKNIDGILKLENTLELLEKTIEKTRKNYEETKNKVGLEGAKKIAKGVWKFLLFLLAVVVILFFAFSSVPEWASLSVDSAFGVINVSTWLTIEISLIFGKIASVVGSIKLVSSLVSFAINTRKSQGLEEQLEYLETYYQQCKTKLGEFKQKTNENDVTPQETEVVSLVEYNRQTTVSMLKSAKMFYKLGYFRKKLLSYYEKGTLREELQEGGYTEEEIQLGEEIISKRFAMTQKRAS